MKRNKSVSLLKKKREFFLIYKEIQKVLGAKSYMRKGFLIYECAANFLALLNLLKGKV
jgi:hypothetical protein